MTNFSLSPLTLMQLVCCNFSCYRGLHRLGYPRLVARQASSPKRQVAGMYCSLLLLLRDTHRLGYSRLIAWKSFQVSGRNIIE